MDKQIEEMAKDVARAGQTAGDWIMEEAKKLLQENGRFKSTEHTRTLSDIVAEELAKMGYRKIPEDAVVLTGTETEERLEDLLIEFDEMSFYPATLMPNAEECAKEWKSKLIYAIGQLRKETAEKFAERVKMAFYYHFDELIPSIMAKDIDEICKEFTGGK